MSGTRTRRTNLPGYTKGRQSPELCRRIHPSANPSQIQSGNVVESRRRDGYTLARRRSHALAAWRARNGPPGGRCSLLALEHGGRPSRDQDPSSQYIFVTAKENVRISRKPTTAPVGRRTHGRSPGICACSVASTKRSLLSDGATFKFQWYPERPLETDYRLSASNPSVG